PETTIKVDVRLVRILATVKDPSGNAIGTLDKSAFTVRDNGAPQTIALFEHQTDQALNVAVLIDNSGSTAKDLKYETDSVTRFLRALFHEGNPDDVAALYSFNWEIIRQNNFSRNVPAMERSLRLLRGDAGTCLYDAIMLASRDIEDRPGRHILVVVTDGGDTTSKTDFNRAVEAAQLADAVIYPILVVPITNGAGRNTGGENALTTFAQRTGGRVFQPTLGAELDHAFDQILKDLRTQYLIAFYPKDVPLTTNRFHPLDLSVTTPGLRVIARSGYYGEALRNPATQLGSGARIFVAPGDETTRTPKKPAPQPQGKAPLRKGP
ncbi:MAG TPA: VWA domain-containing protein, partial [Bryobacteraceae bacterium]|nr:VWA domain-containing protein [Bryobacteraceae bacterium]